MRYSHDHAREHSGDRVAFAATTAADGSFSISNVKPGAYSLTIYAGPAPIVRSVEVKSTGTELGLIQ